MTTRMKLRIHHQIVMALALVMGYCLPVAANEVTAPLNGTVTFPTASAETDYLMVDAGARTIQADKAFKVQGDPLSRIHVDRGVNAGVVKVATVHDREGDSMYHVHGVLRGGGGGGGGGGKDPSDWTALYEYGIDGTLFLYDRVGGPQVSDSRFSNQARPHVWDDGDQAAAPHLYCASRESKGEVEFRMVLQKRQPNVWFKWKITRKDVVIGEGLFEGDVGSDGQAVRQGGLAPGMYVLAVTHPENEAFQREIEFTVLRVRLDAMPRVLAANSQADFPVCFEVEKVPEIEVLRTTLELDIPQVGTRNLSMSRRNARLLSGDAVRDNGSQEQNGKTNRYTALLPAGADSDLRALDFSRSGGYQNGEAKARIKVSFKIPQQEEPNRYEMSSDWVDLDGVLDRNIDVAHLSKRYSDDERNNPHYPALDPFTNTVSKESWREATPTTRIWGKDRDDAQTLWATNIDGDPKRWEYHQEPTDNVYNFRRTDQDGNRGRNVWPDPGGDFNIVLRSADRLMPNKIKGRLWREMLANEEKGAVFVWYWGVKELKDLAGNDVEMINIRESLALSGETVLFDGSSITLNVHTTADEAAEWDWSQAITGTFGLASSTITVAATSPTGPVGWAATIGTYATIINESSKLISMVYDQLTGVAPESLGAKAGAHGLLVITSSDGQPVIPREPHWGDGNGGLGGLDDTSFTIHHRDEITQDAQVNHERPTQVLRTWKVMHSISVSTWREEGMGISPSATAWARFNFGEGPDGRKLFVRSDGEPVAADGQYVGQE